jgi:pSer/pThr/pTyr-binding forkhead associated (FHA) protein
MWKLVIEDDEGKRTVVPLTRDEYTIGRREGNSIRLTERNVSRDHAKLGKRPGPTKDKPIFTLGDVTSYNGVYVNGLRVADKQELAHGDLIQIGDYRIVLQDEGVDAVEGEAEPMSLDPEDLKETVSNAPAIPSPLRATNATFLEKPNRLVVLAGPNPGEEFPLVGERLTIGRAEDATVSINHNSVSRLHCEVHALGDARFEIVDKGSSNGVRVNGADLRRGIIEAGDIIELGDVKFKFVGEGQLFRPGTSESQQLAAISQRSATAVVQVRPAKGNLLPAVLLGTVLALGVIAVYLIKSRPQHADPVQQDTIGAVGSTPPTDTSGADAAMLADARRMCDIGDVEGAHAKANALPPGSPLHASTDFNYIELKWSSMTILQADGEPDPATKAGLYQRLVSDPFADATIKRTAAARLAAIDLTPRDPGKPPRGNGTGAGGRAGTSSGTSTGTTTNTPRVTSNGDTSAVTPPPPPTPRPPRVSATQASLTELATSSNPADWQKARDILDPKVFGKRGATADDVRLLKAICKAQHDQQCVSELKNMQ